MVTEEARTGIKRIRSGKFAPHLLAAATLLIGLIISVGIANTFREAEVEKTETAFIESAREWERTLESGVQQRVEPLGDISAFFQASNFIDRNEFSIFTASDIRTFSGIQGIEWIPRVISADREQFELIAAADGLTEFRFSDRDENGNFVTAPDRDVHYPIFYVEPYEGNEEILGFDLASDPIRLSILEAARDSGKMMLTGPIHLDGSSLSEVDYENSEAGFFAIFPVYKKGQPTETLADRRANIAGFASVAFRSEELLVDILRSQLLDGQVPPVDLLIFDITDPKSVQEIFHSEDVFNPPHVFTDYSNESESIEIVQVMQVGGRSWKLISRPSGAFASAENFQGAWYALSVGFGISVLAAFFVFTTLKRTKTITKLVDERTQELSEANEKLFIQIEERQLAELNLEQFFSQSLDLLCIASIDGYFKKINPMFSELLGYSSEELLSRPFMDFIHPDDIDETASVMQNLAFGKPPSNFENRFRTISGSYRWFEWKATAAHGGILYAAARDITDARESIKVIARLQRHNELILNSAGDGIYGVDINGVITFVNPAAARMLEVQTGNIVGRIESEIIRYSGHDGTAVPWSKSPVHETLVSGRPRQATEHWVTKSNGDTLPVEFIIAPLVEKDGAIVGAVVTFKEITERQEAEERRLADEAKLRDSESRTKAILDLAVDAIITISDKGKIESANKAAETVFGYTADQMIGNNVSMLMPSPFHEGHDQYLGNYQKTGERKVIGIGREVIGLRSDGSTFPMELSVSEVTLGGHHMYTGIVRDITERKEAEERRQAAEASLRDSESRTKAILDLAVDAIITISDKGKIESANKAAERVFGYTADQMIGNNVSMLMPSPFHEGHDQYLGNYQKTGEKKVIGIGREVIGLRSDGSTFPMELSVSEVTLGGHHMYTGIVRDITERKASEEFIKKSEEAKESLLNAIPDLMFRISGKGKILAYRAAENSDDYVSPGELFVGRSIEEAMPGEFAELAKTKIAATLETQAAQTFEYRMPVPIKSKNFRDFEARVHVSGPDEVLVLIRDISERRAVERMKEEFVSTVSHELRTPLTSIRGALGLLDGTMLVDASKQVKRMLQIGISNTDRLSRLINDILDLERLEAGKTELELEEFLVADLVERTIESLQVLANDAGINLSADIDEMTLVADNDKVTQVLTNLVSNAIKFSEKGQPVNVTATISDEEIKISVIDEGRGIPEDSLDSVFGRFQQIDASDSKQKGGTGLGLAICKGIIELHGGRIWAENNPGPGSKFVFTLPRNASQNDDSSGLENVKAA